MARVKLTGILERVKKGEYNGRPDNTLFVESGDDSVMVAVPETVDILEYEAQVGDPVELPCLVTLQKGNSGPFMKFRLRPSFA